jgi:signal transduction histidine kinase
MAGGLAAFTFLPTAVPLGWQMIQAEEEMALRGTRGTARAAYWLVRSGAQADSELLLNTEVDWLFIERQQLLLGRSEPLQVDLSTICPPGETTQTVQTDGALWAVTCHHSDDVGPIVAGTRIEPAQQAQAVMGLVLLLAVPVGLVTALGILRLLAPLGEVTRALARVGAGERGVRMPRTGLSELDDLVDRLNAAAREMEDREDAILGRIEVVQEMARLVAHEVRNPLQSLELLTSLIASEEDEIERMEIAASIHQEIRTLETVVNRLLRESAVKGSLRLQRQPGSLAPLVEQVVTLRRPQANARGTRLEHGALSTRTFPFDQALMKRSIENLVINAMQAIPARGGEIRVSVMEEDPYMVIIVDDNGPGVDEELADQVFEAHVTSKESGTGLGLTLVKGVVEAHNGYIRYARSPLGGARFEARIPFDPGEELSEHPSAPYLGSG